MKRLARLLEMELLTSIEPSKWCKSGRKITKMRTKFQMKKFQINMILEILEATTSLVQSEISRNVALAIHLDLFRLLSQDSR